MSTSPYVCTSTTFVLNEPVASLSLPAQTALRRWAGEHDLALTNLAMGRAIERDDAIRSLRWRAVEDDGVVVHVRYPPFEPGDEPWPRPFPDALLHTADVVHATAG